MSENVSADEQAGSPGDGPEADRVGAVATSVGLALAGTIAGIATLFLLAALLQGLGVAVQEQIVVQYGLSILSLQGIGFIVVVLVFFQVRDRFDIIRIRWPTLRDAGLAVAGIFGLLLLLAVLAGIYTALGVDTPQTSIVEDGMQNPELALFLIPLTYIFVGPGEELLFRGAVQGLLGEAYSRVPAIVIASVIFAFAHVMNVFGAPPTQVVAYLFVIFSLSLLLGALYELTDNIVVPMFVHGTYNSLTFLQLYFVATGGLPS
ncbi:CPBP family intramembrane glutamic endopeptidase [Halorarius litoreus]|uniref:CPBP family intramembrane glutamic endopeptidase n=1 Tax=Halorarius litoreus TaxID=2962676 RepID=UPI0020CD7D15|nr:CPBP family intramembrane glutamic endopeptidase [Halorarius litoreus]